MGIGYNNLSFLGKKPMGGVAVEGTGVSSDAENHRLCQLRKSKGIRKLGDFYLEQTRLGEGEKKSF